MEGATGFISNKINGFYKRESDLKYQRIFYLYESKAPMEAINLMYDSDSERWVIGQAVGSKKETRVLAYCSMPKMSNPCNATRWYVCNASSEFLVHPCMNLISSEVEEKRIRKKIIQRNNISEVVYAFNFI